MMMFTVVLVGCLILIIVVKFFVGEEVRLFRVAALSPTNVCCHTVNGQAAEVYPSNHC